MKKCNSCERSFPDDLIQEMAESTAGKLRYRRMCPLCALQERNAAHGLPPDTPFSGPIAADMHRRALEFVKGKS